VRNLANGGISWGTNNYPGGSAYGWFGGSTGGIGSLPPISGDIDASDVIAQFDSFLRLYSRIRRTRIRITRTRSNYSSGNGYPAIYDATAIAHLSDSYRINVPVQTHRSTTWSATTSYSTATSWTRSTAYSAITIWNLNIKTGASNSRTTTKYRNTTVSRNTTTSHTTAKNANTDHADPMVAGQLAVQASFDRLVEQMRRVYYAYARNTIHSQYLTRNICHDSCHSNCHDSRGRR
jgi:hypothetical protein